MPTRKPSRKPRSPSSANSRSRDLYPAPLAMPRLVYGFPEKMYVKMRYVDTYAISSTTGSIAKQVININSTFDPDSTGTGHQPLYRDTYAGVYNHYSVVKAKVKLTFNSNATTSAVVVGALIDDDSASSSTLSTLLEQNRGVHALCAQASGSMNNKTLSLDWDCRAVLGIDPFATEGYKTPVGSNPSELSNCIIYACPIDGVSTTSTTILMELEQWVLWSELVTPSSS